MFKGLFSNPGKDLNAGLVVFLVAIPLCLGIALASKAPIMSGILAGIIGGIIVGFFSGSELGVSGPAAGLVTVVLAGQQDLGSFEAFGLAVLIAGIIQFVLGIVRAGFLTSFFPLSVIKGMLAAIGIIIFLKQIPHAVGFDKDYEGDLDFFQSDGHNTLTELAFMFDALSIGAIVISVTCLAVLIVWGLPPIQKHKILKLVPGPLLAVVTGIALHTAFGMFKPDWVLANEHLVQVPENMGIADWITFPDFSEITNQKVWLYAAIIAGIASVESLLCAEATDKIDPQKRVGNKNKELIAQGIGNALAGLVGALPITQVVVRSSANVQAGAQSRLSSIVHGVLIFLAVALAPFVLNLIPNASLAAILMLIGYKLAQPALFKKQFKKGWAQFIPFVITIFAILITDLLTGVAIGMAFGIFFILRQNLRAPYHPTVSKAKNGHLKIEIKLAEIVSFLNKGILSQTLQEIPANAIVYIDGSNSGEIDPDVIEVVEDFMESEKTLKKGIKVEFEYKKPSKIAPNPYLQLKQQIKKIESHSVSN